MKCYVLLWFAKGSDFGTLDVWIYYYSGFQAFRRQPTFRLRNRRDGDMLCFGTPGRPLKNNKN